MMTTKDLRDQTSELSRELKKLRELGADAMEFDGHNFVSYVSDWKDNKLYKYFNPTWDEFLREYFNQSPEWVEHIVEGMALLGNNQKVNRFTYLRSISNGQGETKAAHCPPPPFRNIILQRVSNSLVPPSDVLMPSEIKHAELPGELQFLREILFEQMEQRCRDFETQMKKWQEDDFYQYFAPTWEQFVRENFRQSPEWVEHMVHAVALLDHDEDAAAAEQPPTPIPCRELFAQDLPEDAILPGSVVRIAGLAGIVLTAAYEDQGTGLEWSFLLYTHDEGVIPLCGSRSNIEVLSSPLSTMVNSAEIEAALTPLNL